LTNRYKYVKFKCSKKATKCGSLNLGERGGIKPPLFYFKGYFKRGYVKRKNKKIWIFVLILFVCGFVFIIGGVKEVLADGSDPNGGSGWAPGGGSGIPPLQIQTEEVPIEQSRTPTQTGTPDAGGQGTTFWGSVPNSLVPHSSPGEITGLPPVRRPNTPGNPIFTGNPQPTAIPFPTSISRIGSPYPNTQPNNNNLALQPIGGNSLGFNPQSFNNQPLRYDLQRPQIESRVLPQPVNQQVTFRPVSKNLLNLNPLEQNFRSVNNNPSNFNIPQHSFNNKPYNLISSQQLGQKNQEIFSLSFQPTNTLWDLSNQLTNQKPDTLKLTQITIQPAKELNPINLNNIKISQPITSQNLKQPITTIQLDRPTIPDIKPTTTQKPDTLKLLNVDFKLNNQVFKKNIISFERINKTDLYNSFELLNKQQLDFIHLLKDREIQGDLEVLKQNRYLESYIFNIESFPLYIPEKTILLNKIIDFLQYGSKEVQEEYTLDYFDTESLLFKDIPELKDKKSLFLPSLKI